MVAEAASVVLEQEVIPFDATTVTTLRMIDCITPYSTGEFTCSSAGQSISENSISDMVRRPPDNFQTPAYCPCLTWCCAY